MTKLVIPVVCLFGVVDINNMGEMLMNWLSVRVPLSRYDIDSLEKELSITLPEDYKSEIGPINGGALRNAYIKSPELGEVSYSRNVSLHRGAKTGIFDLIGIFNDDSIKLFPFASVGNGDYFCFDLVSNTVVLYLHEIQATRYVCDTFSQLLCTLTSE